MADLTLRAEKGSPLSNDEVDANFVELANRIETASQVNPKLSAIATAVWAANQMLYMTGADTVAMTALSPLARQILGGETPTDIKTLLNLQFVQNTVDSEKEVSGPQQAALDLKVDKVAGLGLSATSFTQSEKDKLAGLESSHYRGLYITLEALQVGATNPRAGDYADVDPGVGTDIVRYIWDSNDTKWVLQPGAVPPLTAAQVKSLYESNPDTQAFHDADRAKLDGIAAGATANATNAQLRDRSTHTGTQLAETISDFAATVRSTLLDGFSTASALAVVASDTVLAALGKLQAQVSARLPLAGGNLTGPVNWAAGAILSSTAGVVELNPSTSNFVRMYATGTVTSFGGSALPIGAVRTVRVENSEPIIQSNANIITPGGVDLYCTLLDVITLYKLSASVWVVLDYHRGDGSLLDRAIPITTTGATLDLSAVTARSVVVTLANDVTAITLPAYTATRKYRRLELVVVNSGNFKLSGWPVGVAFEAGTAAPAKTGIGARTTYQLSKIDALSWFMYGSTVGGGELSVRGPSGNRLFLPGAITGGILTNVSSPVNIAKIIPFSVSRPMRVKQLSIRVGTANAGTSTMCIYNNDGDLTGKTDLPGTQLASTAVGGIAHTAAQNVADCNCLLLPGVLYWIAWAPSIATAMYHYPLLQTQTCMGYNSGLTTFCAMYTLTVVGNALPTSINTPDLVEFSTIRPALYIVEDVS